MFVSPGVSSSVIEEAVEAAGGNMSQMSDKKKGKTHSEEESEEADQGLSCVWHPWRPAYAICNYCHRPFCFEKKRGTGTGKLHSFRDGYIILKTILKNISG